MDDKKATKNPLGDLLRSLPPEKAAAAFMGAMEALEKAKPMVIEVEHCGQCPFNGEGEDCNAPNGTRRQACADSITNGVMANGCPLRGTAGVLVRAKA